MFQRMFLGLLPAIVPGHPRPPSDAGKGANPRHSKACVTVVRAKTKSILDMAGMLKAPKGKQISVEDMNPWR